MRANHYNGVSTQPAVEFDRLLLCCVLLLQNSRFDQNALYTTRLRMILFFAEECQYSRRFIALFLYKVTIFRGNLIQVLL